MKTLRPWGWMSTLLKTPWFWVKILQVDGRTSLQTHTDRTEYHIGFHKVKRNEPHRLMKGFYIEFAIGRPDEEDIERLEDDYGRM